MEKRPRDNVVHSGLSRNWDALGKEIQINESIPLASSSYSSAISFAKASWTKEPDSHFPALLVSYRSKPQGSRMKTGIKDVSNVVLMIGSLSVSS